MADASKTMINGFWLVSFFWIALIIVVVTMVLYWLNKKIKHKYIKYIFPFIFLTIGIYFHILDVLQRPCEADICGWNLLLSIPCYIIFIILIISSIIADFITFFKNKK